MVAEDDDGPPSACSAHEAAAAARVLAHLFYKDGGRRSTPRLRTRARRTPLRCGCARCRSAGRGGGPQGRRPPSWCPAEGIGSPTASRVTDGARRLWHAVERLQREHRARSAEPARRARHRRHERRNGIVIIDTPTPPRIHRHQQRGGVADLLVSLSELVRDRRVRLRSPRSAGCPIARPASSRPRRFPTHAAVGRADPTSEAARRRAGHPCARPRAWKPRCCATRVNTTSLLMWCRGASSRSSRARVDPPSTAPGAASS